VRRRGSWRLRMGCPELGPHRRHKVGAPPSDGRRERRGRCGSRSGRCVAARAVLPAPTCRCNRWCGGPEQGDSRRQEAAGAASGRCAPRKVPDRHESRGTLGTSATRAAVACLEAHGVVGAERRERGGVRERGATPSGEPGRRRGGVGPRRTHSRAAPIDADQARAQPTRRGPGASAAHAMRFRREPQPTLVARAHPAGAGRPHSRLRGAGRAEPWLGAGHGRLRWSAAGRCGCTAWGTPSRRGRSCAPPRRRRRRR
jgi:hypothetical protein